MLSPQALFGALVLLSAPSAVVADTCKAPINHPGEPFSFVQPLNTTILTPYGHSPPAYPSRKQLCPLHRLGFVDF